MIPTWLSVHFCFYFEAPHWHIAFNGKLTATDRELIIIGHTLFHLIDRYFAWTSWLLWISKLHNMSWWCRPVEWRPLPISPNNKFSVLLAFLQLLQWLMRIYKQFLTYQMSVSEEEYDRWQALRHVIILHLWISRNHICSRLKLYYTSKSHPVSLISRLSVGAHYLSLIYSCCIFIDKTLLHSNAPSRLNS